MKKILIILLLSFNIAKAATIVIPVTSNWSACAIAPGDIVHVLNGATLTIDVANAQCSSLILGGSGISIYFGCYAGTTIGNTTGKLKFNAGKKLTITGLIQLGATAGVAATAGSLDMTNGYLACQGFNVVSEGVYVVGGTVELTATNSLPIAPSAIKSFNNLIINGGTTTLTQATSLLNTGVLTLTTGILKLNTNNLSINNTATAAIVRTGGYILSEDAPNNNSSVSWIINGITGNHIFPFGSSFGVYIPFTYNLTAGNAGTVQVATYHTAVNNTPYPLSVTAVYDTTYTSTNDANYVVDRFWGISSLGGTANMTFVYDDPNDDISLVGGKNGSDGTGLRAQQWNGSTAWLRYYSPAQTINSAANLVTINSFSGSLTNLKPWTLALRIHPLPITLISFNVIKDNGALVYWTTETEINNKYFYVQRSVDGKIFSDITQLDGKVNSVISNTYSYTDKQPLYGISYYRLKQVDINGEETYSNIVSFLNKRTIIDSLIVYPNPSETIILFSFKANENIVANISIYNIKGELMKKKTFSIINGINILELDIDKLVTGNYFFSVTENEIQHIGQFIKQ